VDSVGPLTRCLSKKYLWLFPEIFIVGGFNHPFQTYALVKLDHFAPGVTIDEQKHHDNISEASLPTNSSTIKGSLVGGFNPIEKYAHQNGNIWESSPNSRENKKALKPPLSSVCLSWS